MNRTAVTVPVNGIVVITDWSEEWRENYPDMRIAFSCRRGGYREIPPGTDTVESILKVSHNPPSECEPYRQLLVLATVESNQPELLSVELHFRTLGDTTAYYVRPMQVVDLDRFEVMIPARIVRDYGAEYYIVARIGRGVSSAGSTSTPFQVFTSYSYTADIPEELPGDEFLEEFIPPGQLEYGSSPESEEMEDEKPGTFGIQILIVLIIATIAILLYQRFGS